MKSAIKEVVEKAEKASSLMPEIEVLNSEIGEFEILKKNLEGLLPNLLPIEDEAKVRIQKKINETVNRHYEANKKKKRLEVLESLASKYHKLSLEPLKWRNDEGFPRLVLFSLKSSEFVLSVRSGLNYVDVLPKLPCALSGLYNDVSKSLNRNKKRTETTIELKCKFSGMIPAEVKKKIREAETIFDEKNIFIIAEMKEYQLNEFMPIPEGDPLVVGFHPIDETVLWLIADFDTTSVEEAMIFTRTE